MTDTTNAAAEAEAKAPPSFTVFDHEFQSDRVYVEGHVLTAGEAAHLTQTYKENISNLVRSKYRTMLKAANEASEDEVEKLSGAQLTAWKRECAKIIDEYEMQERTAGSGSSRDPVQSKATTLARKWLVDALRSKGTSLKAARAKNPEAVEAKIAQRAAMEDIQTLAAELVAQEAKVGAQALDELSLDNL